MADFHPIDCHVFAFATSKGAIRLADLRASALADNTCKSFEEVRLRTALLAAPNGSRVPALTCPVAQAACLNYFFVTAAGWCHTALLV